MGELAAAGIARQQDFFPQRVASVDIFEDLLQKLSFSELGKAARLKVCIGEAGRNDNGIETRLSNRFPKAAGEKMAAAIPASAVDRDDQPIGFQWVKVIRKMDEVFSRGSLDLDFN
jgi:hypothetical protein